MDDFKNRLARMTEAWKAGREVQQGIPDGVYKMQLQKCELRESASSGRLMIAREHLICEGEYAGESVRDFIVLETEFGPRQASEFIQVMGYEAPEEASELEEVISAIEADAPTYTAQVRKSKDSDLRNVRIRALVEAGTAPVQKQAEVKKSTPAPAPIIKKKEATPEPEEVKEEAASFSVGDSVSFQDGDDTHLGKITEVKGDSAVVKTAEGEFEVPVEILCHSDQNAPAASEKDHTDLLVFCQSHDIACSEDDTRDELITKVKGYEFDKDELTPEEVGLLEAIGATFAAPKKKVSSVGKPKLTAQLQKKKK